MPKQSYRMEDLRYILAAEWRRGQKILLLRLEREAWWYHGDEGDLKLGRTSGDKEDLELGGTRRDGRLRGITSSIS